MTVQTTANLAVEVQAYGRKDELSITQAGRVVAHVPQDLPGAGARRQNVPARTGP
jgi:hypothetical protein